MMATGFNGTGSDPMLTSEPHDAGPASTPRAAVYLRVSTGRQAEHDLSIPDQRAQTHAWVKQRGWQLVAEYVEPGASATDDRRPEFQRMIERAMFEAVQSLLKARNPRVTAPRIVTGPVLLTGFAMCATCRGAMTLRTGTSKTGKVHRYYTCSSCARQGSAACKGRSIRMDKLDGLVTTHLADRLLRPDRLTALLASVAGRQAEKAATLNERLRLLEKEAFEADERLRRLYALVEEGSAAADDVLQERITALRADRDRARAALERAQAGVRPLWI